MKRVFAIWAVLALTTAAWAQTRALMQNKEVVTQCERAVELMESTAITVPELVRAAAPVTENARQAIINLRALTPQHSALTYTFLQNARAFLLLYDSLPKSQPLTAEARRQFVELREIVDRFETHFRALLESKETALRNPDRDNVRRYAEANAKLQPPLPGRPRVVFFGDSITDFWRLNEYYEDRDFVNRGISGQITGEMLGRMKPDVVDLRPGAVLILAGTNDIARGVPVRTIQNNLTMMADIAQANNIKPLFASVLPVSDYHKETDPANERTRQRPIQTIATLNTWIQNFCKQRNFVYVDYYTHVVDKAGFLRADLSDDGLHPNGAGYRLMAPVALTAIDKVLKPGTGRKR